MNKDQIQVGRRLFFRNSVFLGLYQIARYFFPLITLPFLARVLETDSYSVRAYVVSLMVFMQTIADYGFSQYGAKLLSEKAESSEEASRAYSCIQASRCITVLIGAVISAGVALLIPFLQGYFLFVMIAYIGIACKVLVPDFVLQGFEDMRPIAVRFVVSQVFSLVLILLFVRGPQDLILVAILSLSALPSLCFGPCTTFG